MRRSILSLLAALSLTAALAGPAQAARPVPDLIPIEPNLTDSFISVSSRTFDPSQFYDRCSVEEGSIPDYGTYKLLRFPTTLANVGTSDLKIGDPSLLPDWYEFQPCHGHYHFKDYADYALLDGAGNVVGVGHKQGFCFVDTFPYTARSSRPRYGSCDDDQGLSKGWADIYDWSLDGQWIVVDGLPAGVYTLRVTINPARLLPESSYANNTITVPVSIP